MEYKERKEGRINGKLAPKGHKRRPFQVTEQSTSIHVEDSGPRIIPPSLRFLSLHFGEVLLFCLWVCPLPYLSALA